VVRGRCGARRGFAVGLAHGVDLEVLSHAILASVGGPAGAHTTAVRRALDIHTDAERSRVRHDDLMD
jgi:hypothetical protein